MNLDIQFDPELHEYYQDGIRKPSVTWILSTSGLCDFSFVEEETRRRALERGKSVHWMTQLEDEGTLNYRTMPRALRPYRKAYLGWKRSTGFFPNRIEHQFISMHGYAGTIDRTGRLEPTEMYPHGSDVIVDLKTNSAQEWVRYQLAAYIMGIYSHSQARKFRRIALVLRADGTHRVKEFLSNTLQHDFSVFLDAKRRVECLS